MSGDGIEQSDTPGYHYDAIAHVARRWDISVGDADSFLESVGYFEWSVDTQTDGNGGEDR